MLGCAKDLVWKVNEKAANLLRMSIAVLLVIYFMVLHLFREGRNRVREMVKQVERMIEKYPQSCDDDDDEDEDDDDEDDDDEDGDDDDDGDEDDDDDDDDDDY